MRDITRDCAGLPPFVVLVYLRLRVARLLGLRSDRRKLRRPRRSLLFVCRGNVMRSPLAAELTRSRLGSRSPEFAVASAGIWTTNGRPADPRATRAAAEFHVFLTAHESRIITPLMVSRADLICVMDHRLEAELLARFPRAAGKTILLGGAAGWRGASASIDDPYALDDEAVARTFRRLSEAVDELVSRLRSR